MLPLPLCRRNAATNVALTRCHHPAVRRRRASRCRRRCAPAMLPPTLRCRAPATATVLRADAFVLPPSHCVLPLRFALPPPPRRRHAATDIALSRYRHFCSLRAAATPLPPSHCALPPRFALLPPTLCRRQAADKVALSRCCHRHSIRAAAFALPPSCCAPLQRFKLPPPPLTLSLPPCCRQAAAEVALLPPPQHLHCCIRAAAIAPCTAASLRAAATAADAVAAAAAAAKLLPTSRWRAGTLPPPSTPRCRAAATAADAATATALPPSCLRRRADALPPPPLTLPLPPRRPQAAADFALSRCRAPHRCRSRYTPQDRGVSLWCNHQHGCRRISYRGTKNLHRMSRPYNPNRTVACFDSALHGPHLPPCISACHRRT
jgi:hypothetical protein